MADSPSTGVSILQILSVPALLAVITGVGSFLKSLWDRWTERRSLIGLQKLTDYLDADSKREVSLLTGHTRSLIDYEVNLKFRELAGAPAHDAVERVERWRRRPYLVKAMWFPPEIRVPSQIKVKSPEGGAAEPPRRPLPRNLVLFFGQSLEFKLILFGLSLLALVQVYGESINIFLITASGNGTTNPDQYILKFFLIFVFLVTERVFTNWASELAEADRNARKFVRENGQKEIDSATDDR